MRKANILVDLLKDRPLSGHWMRKAHYTTLEFYDAKSTFDCGYREGWIE